MTFSAFEFTIDEYVTANSRESSDRGWEQSLTLSSHELVEFPEEAYNDENRDRLNILVASKNQIEQIPSQILLCTALKRLDLSKNQIRTLPKELFQLPNLRYVDLGSNLLCELSLSFTDEVGNAVSSSRITHLVLSNNKFTVISWWVLMLENLVHLHMGANLIKSLPSCIDRLRNLKDLYLGGNKLMELPESVGSMHQLNKLIVNDNQLGTIPDTLTNLDQLKSLMLHGNRLKVLPQSLIKLENLEELSLRGNPLVDRFVRTMNMYHVPSLKELSSRYVVNNRLIFNHDDLPKTLLQYLKTSQRCINPACSGVYFTSCVEHVKFVDFCGRFRVPFLIYLCSPSCEYPEAESTSSSDSEPVMGASPMHLRRVLLG
ncbi:uncharacterized protein LOC142351030 [Convolutriloba macropyga]|uniref:uncharacterized protein LOC142351030 n=1 Tax=Convolutriloba macropyga TaxID=536237 RepID=UPI003F52643C